MDTAEAPAQKSTLLCVLGMHRSGTSAVTHFIYRLGAAVGSSLLEPMADINAEGFWEDSRLVALNEQLLALHGLRWYDCADIGPVAAEQMPVLRAAAVTHLQGDYASHPIAVLKDPRLCRLLPFWLDACRECGVEPRFVHVLRHPVEVAKSLYRRDRIPYEYAMLLWLIHTLEALQHAPAEASLLVSYDRALADPAGLAALLERWCGFAAAPDRLAAAGLALKPALKRQGHELDVELGTGALVELAAEVYRQLLVFENGPVPAEVVAALLRRYRELRDEMAADIAMLRRLAGELMEFSAETVRIGELHSYALSVVAERDQALQEKETERQNLLRGIAAMEEKTKEIEVLNGLLATQRDRLDAEKDQLVAEKVQTIMKMEREMAEKDRQLHALRVRIGEMEGSYIWRLISRFTGQ